MPSQQHYTNTDEEKAHSKAILLATPTSQQTTVKAYDILKEIAQCDVTANTLLNTFALMSSM